MKRKKRRKKFEMPNGFKDVEEMNKCIAQTKLEKLRYKVPINYLCVTIGIAAFIIVLFCFSLFEYKLFDEFNIVEVYSDGSDEINKNVKLKIYYVDGIRYVHKVKSPVGSFGPYTSYEHKYIFYNVKDPSVSIMGRTRAIVTLHCCITALLITIAGLTMHQIKVKKKKQKKYNEEKEKIKHLLGNGGDIE